MFVTELTKHGINRPHDIFHLRSVNDPRIVQIIHLEGPNKFVLRCSGSNQINCQQELFEIKVAIVISIQCPMLRLGMLVKLS